METLIPSPPLLLPLLLLLPPILYLVSIVRRKVSDNRANLPPGSNGWPILGENIDYALLGSQQLVKDRMQKYSPNVFNTTLFGSKMAVLCGPEGNKFVFKNELFMNVVDVERLEKLLEPFSAMTDGMLSLDLDLPGTSFRGAVEGGKVVRNEVKRIIEERREDVVMEMKEGVDLLSRMVMIMDEDGKHLSDAMITNFMMGLLVATQYEVSYAITIVIYYLAQFPHIYDRVLEEQMEIVSSKGPGDLLTWDDIGKMKYTWNVVCESFRLAPPAHGSFRETTTEITYAGFTIPKGWKIMWSVHSCHKNPNYFPEPEKFDPSRYEGSGPAPYTYVPFGGGSRICPGRGYAKLVILVFIHNVVTRFRLEKVIPNEKMVFHATTRPAHGLPLHLHPHKK